MVMVVQLTLTELQVGATNYARRDARDTTDTWRKVCGAGGVRFTPNASWDSKRTTVSFIDAKPGKRITFVITIFVVSLGGSRW